MPPAASRICVVTGGASGIGLATVRRFLAQGATVVVFDVQRMEALPAAAIWHEVDIARADQVRTSVAAVLARHGRVDVLVNSAGIGMQLASVEDLALEEWQRVLDVNLTGTLSMVQAVLPSMKARNAGAIVNVGSSFGLTARRFQSAYAVSKAAVIHLTRCIALDLGESAVRVNCVCPGLIDTPLTSFLQRPENSALRREHLALHAMNRAGGPDEVAAAIEFLASDAASYVTGHAMAVDGGYTAGKWVE